MHTNLPQKVFTRLLRQIDQCKLRIVELTFSSMPQLFFYRSIKILRAYVTLSDLHKFGTIKGQINRSKEQFTKQLINRFQPSFILNKWSNHLIPIIAAHQKDSIDIVRDNTFLSVRPASLHHRQHRSSGWSRKSGIFYTNTTILLIWHPFFN